MDGRKYGRTDGRRDGGTEGRRDGGTEGERGRESAHRMVYALYGLRKYGLPMVWFAHCMVCACMVCT